MPKLLLGLLLFMPIAWGDTAEFAVCTEKECVLPIAQVRTLAQKVQLLEKRDALMQNEVVRLRKELIYYQSLYGLCGKEI